MRIVLIGAGNLMTSLSHALQGAGHDILQVFSRTSPSADSLAQVLQCEAVTDIHRLNCDADVYILAVKDSVFQHIAATMQLYPVVVLIDNPPHFKQTKRILA